MPQTLAMPKPPGEPKVKTPEMNDRDRINDILATVKYMTQGYNTGLNEMQNPALHQTVANVLKDLHDMQFDAFNAMFQRGWYKIKTAEKNEVTKAYDQFNNYHSQFPDFQG